MGTIKETVGYFLTLIYFFKGLVQINKIQIEYHTLKNRLIDWVYCHLCVMLFWTFKEAYKWYVLVGLRSNQQSVLLVRGTTNLFFEYCVCNVSIVVWLKFIFIMFRKVGIGV